MRDVWDVYLCVFFTLEFASEQMACPGDALREFLSDANPFLWADKGSADPAIWIEFEHAFSSRFPDGDCTDEASLAFVREYLASQGAYYVGVFPDGDTTSFLELFDRETDLAEWTRMLDDVERQEQSDE